MDCQGGTAWTVSTAWMVKQGNAGDVTVSYVCWAGASRRCSGHKMLDESNTSDSPYFNVWDCPLCGIRNLRESCFKCGAHPSMGQYQSWKIRMRENVVVGRWALVAYRLDINKEHSIVVSDQLHPAEHMEHVWERLTRMLDSYKGNLPESMSRGLHGST